jgi:phosphinothricin acetyltransferase
MTNGYERVKLGDIALASRSISTAAFGPGSAVLSSGLVTGGKDNVSVMAKTKSKSAYSVRAATPDDLTAIVGIYNWAVNQTFATIDSEPLSAEEAKAWWEMHGKRSKLLVATDDTGVIGWARLLPWKQRGFDVVESLVYVDPVHHGQGIGATLLKALTTEARGLGYLTIVASVATDNRAGLALFTKQGFGEVGTIRNAAHKFDRWMDITLVQKELEG